jgi:hypothetical protein
MLGFSSQLQAKSCTVSPSGGTIDLVDCTYDSGDPLENPNSGKDLSFNLNMVSGYISEIVAKSSTDTTHRVVITSSTNLNIGKLFNNVAKTGSLELRNNSTVNFTGEGLQTHTVKLTSSKLVLDGTSQINKIEQSLELADDKAKLFLDNGASLQATLIDGKAIKGSLEILNGSSMDLTYDDANVGTEDAKIFNIASLSLNGKDSTLIKSGTGEVAISNFSLQIPKDEEFKVIVEGGILDIGAIGDQYSKSANSFQIHGGQLKFSGGNLKANIDTGGEIYLLGEEAEAKMQINPSTYKDDGSIDIQGNIAGKLIVDGKALTLINTNLETLNVKSGNVIININELNKDYTTNITNLIIEGGNVSTANKSPLIYFSNITVSNGGQFRYSDNHFNNDTLNNLEIFEKGEFLFAGNKDLILDGVNKNRSCFQDGDADCGIITVSTGTNSGKLTLQNSDVGTVTISSSNGAKSLILGNNVEIGRLNLSFLNEQNSIDIDSSHNVHEIEMSRRGSVNIKGGADIRTFINNSAFAPIINIEGNATVENVELNNSGTVKIAGDAKVTNLNLLGQEKVEIGENAELDTFTMQAKSSKAEVVMDKGKINTFILASLIDKLELNETEINTYKITLEDQTFDFNQQKVKNLVLDGKKSVINLGKLAEESKDDEIPNLETIILDQGTLNYNYRKDNTIRSITTTVDHPLYPPEECEEDDKKCEEEEAKKPKFDTEFNINAGDATLTTGEVKLESMNLESGYLEVKSGIELIDPNDPNNTILSNGDLEIQRKLTLSIDKNNKILDINNPDSSRARIYADGDIKLGGELNAKFNDTYKFLLGMDNYFKLVEAGGKIDKADDTSFNFLTNLSYWFEVNLIDDNPNLLIANINRKYTYSDVMNHNGASGAIYDIASLLDEYIKGVRTLNPEDTIGEIITGLDTRSHDGPALITNISKLMPVSNRAYANSVHTNNQKVVDTLSSELRDFTNLEDNLWAKLQYTTATLRNNKDVVGYNENSNAMQVGYSKIISSKAVLGGSLSYLTGSLNGNFSSYTQDFTTFNAAIGLDYLFTSKIYGKTILSYSQTEFENTRNLDFIKEFNRSSLGSSEALAHIESGYITSLGEKYYDFNATYNVFYSIGSIAIDSYSEEGVGRLNVDGANILVNDFGVGATFDKEIFYDRNDVSLKPTIGLAMGVRNYSSTETNFEFQEIPNARKFQISNGSYLPIFVKYKMGIDYIVPWANISVNYRFETNANKYTDSSFTLSFKHSF